MVELNSQFYDTYQNWEDYKNGLYRDCAKENRQKYIDLSTILLSNQLEFEKQITKMFEEWPISTKINLTNASINHNSWIGQAACCFYSKSPESCTREAWGLIPETIRNKANCTAKKCADKWIKNNKKRECDEQQILFGF